MLLKHGAEVLHINKSCLHGDIHHAVALLQIHGSLLQANQADEVLWCLTGQVLQSSIEEGAAHCHLSTEAVDIEIGVAQVGHHQLSGLIDEGLVLWIQLNETSLILIG